jgi:hypothetical protein
LHLEAAPLGRLPIFPTTPARREHIRAKQKERCAPRFGVIRRAAPHAGDQAGRLGASRIKVYAVPYMRPSCLGNY